MKDDVIEIADLLLAGHSMEEILESWKRRPWKLTRSSRTNDKANKSDVNPDNPDDDDDDEDDED